jgi:hypothetical protein
MYWLKALGYFYTEVTVVCLEVEVPTRMSPGEEVVCLVDIWV